MLSSRTVTLCTCLFIASAIVSLSFRSWHHQSPWPSLFNHNAAPAVPEAYANVAFATFLSGDPKAKAKPDEGDPAASTSSSNKTTTTADEPFDADAAEATDGYFLSARVLVYNILHNPATRTTNSIPFIVLVTSDVSAGKRARLAADGATVILADKLTAGWVHPNAARWRDVLSKLRLFQLPGFRKICFIDADHLVTAPLDGVFDDPATDLFRTKADPDAIRSDEAPLPSSYMFAGKPDAWDYNHQIPPGPGDYLNGGFFVFRPSEELFTYYTSVLAIPDRFDPGFMEQNLLNYAHRRNGNMPWQTLGWRWNMNWPTVRDFDMGARSFHAKYWENDPTHDQVLKRKWEAQRDEMRGYYRGVDDTLGRNGRV